MIVDAHHHLWVPERGYDWLNEPSLVSIRRPFTIDDLRGELTAHGVAATVLVEGGREDVAEAAELLAIADEAKEIVAVVAWADPADPALASTLAAYRALPGGHKLAGIRAQVQGQADPDWLMRPEVLAGLRTMAANDLVYDLVVRPDQLPAAARAAAAVPELTFVLDHLGKPRVAAGEAGLAEWRARVAPLAAHGNVVAKLSGLVTEADWDSWTPDDLRPFVRTALELFGPDRLLFGSDWPVCLLAARYGAVLDAMRVCLAGLPAADQTAIFGANAIRVYKKGEH